MTARVRHVLWQALSIVLHPFGVLSGLWLLALWRHRPDAIWQQAWPMLLAIAVCATYVLWRWQRGDWSTVDASDKRERASLYAVILPVILVLALWQGGWASVTGRALLYFALALMLALLGNRRLKTSLHLLGLGFAVPIAWQLWPRAGDCWQPVCHCLRLRVWRWVAIPFRKCWPAASLDLLPGYWQAGLSQPTEPEVPCVGVVKACESVKP